MVIVCTLQQRRQIRPVTCEEGVICCRCHAPRTGKRIIFQPCACFFREDVRIFPICIAAFFCLCNNSLCKIHPAVMADIPFSFFPCVCLQNKVHTLSHQVGSMPRCPLPVVPPAPIAPFAVMLCQVGQIVLLIYELRTIWSIQSRACSNSFILQRSAEASIGTAAARPFVHNGGRSHVFEMASLSNTKHE